MDLDIFYTKKLKNKKTGVLKLLESNTIDYTIIILTSIRFIAR